MEMKTQKMGDVLVIEMSGDIMGGTETVDFRNLIYQAIEDENINIHTRNSYEDIGRGDKFALSNCNTSFYVANSGAICDSCDNRFSCHTSVYY